MSKTNDLIIEFLSLLGISKESVEISENETLEILVTIPEDQKGLLIGRHAQTLDSIQFVLSLMINNQVAPEEHLRVLLDIGEYRAKRFEKISELVEEISSSVLETGQTRSLSGLSPTERRQVHLLISENEKLTTYSQGEGPDRRLFIAPKV